MLSGFLAFVSPWALGLLAALPVLWWLLRLLPPAPRKIGFPAIALLRGLIAPEETPARMPLWLLVLRMAACALIILAFAGPVMHPSGTAMGAGDVLIAVDNDWASARAWDKRRAALDTIIAEAAREKRDVIILQTAPPASGEAIQVSEPLPPAVAQAEISRMQPMPWAADWRAASKALENVEAGRIAYAYWLNGGLGGNTAGDFRAALSNFGTPRVLSDADNPAYVIVPPQTGDNAPAYALRAGGIDAEAKIAALAADGRLLAEGNAHWPAGETRAAVTLDLPQDMHNEAARFEIEGQGTAAAALLLDEGWQKKSVGLVGDTAEASEHSLLSGSFYISRALQPFADIHVGSVAELLAQNPSVIILADDRGLDSRDIPSVKAWIEKGGTLLRFAGEILAAPQSPEEAALLPTALRTGDRALGGALSWAAPQKLHAFPAASPFAGLTIPADVAINRQVLAEPASDLAEKSWASLEDGTPLVTAKKMGRGLSVLFHVPARSEWSNLPLSGLFVDMLRRILAVSNGAADIDFTELLPQETLDGFGVLHTPGAVVQKLESGAPPEIGPVHPPGYYGLGGARQALNLGSTLTAPEMLKAGESYDLENHASDLKPFLLAAAFILLLADFVISLYLRGILRFNLRRAGVLVLALALLAQPAHALDSARAVELTSKTWLGYMRTGDRATDSVSQAGLEGLARVLMRRTSIDDVGVAGVDPAGDELPFFPLVYWPLRPGAQPLVADAVRHINDYLRKGGMILIDSDPGMNEAEIQRELTGISIPALETIPENHVLRRSFYLIDEFPGRFEGNGLWVEPADAETNDGVAAVIAGSSGWAGAWAMDASGRPMFPCAPGGEAQRERAYRFGVNIVMYALTGNYKSDQMHAEALLKRFGK